VFGEVGVRGTKYKGVVVLSGRRLRHPDLEVATDAATSEVRSRVAAQDLQLAAAMSELNEREFNSPQEFRDVL
jgi:hypothetical protein